MKIPSDVAGLPAALLVSLLLMIGVAAFGIAAGPDVRPGRPTTAQVPADQPQGDEPSNEAVLQEALGDAFEVSDGEVVADRLEGLPVELSARAYVSVIPAAVSSFVCPPDDEPNPCVRVTVSDRTVEVVRSEAVHSAAGSNFGALMVRYVRPDGLVAVIELSAQGNPAGGSSSALEDAVRTWLDAREQALISAVTDRRLVPGGTHVVVEPAPLGDPPVAR